MYHVIFCNDPWLLARMMTDLQMEGYGLYDFDHPWMENRNWLSVNPGTGLIMILNHTGLFNPIRHTLTEDNYLEVLGKVVGSK